MLPKDMLIGKREYRHEHAPGQMGWEDRNFAAVCLKSAGAGWLSGLLFSFDTLVYAGGLSVAFEVDVSALPAELWAVILQGL